MVSSGYSSSSHRHQHGWVVTPLPFIRVASGEHAEMTDKLVIQGKRPLVGSVTISGAKNSVLKLMAAALLTEQQVTLTNVPNLTDVQVMASLLEKLGRTVQFDTANSTLTIMAGQATCLAAPYELVSKMRASFNVLGALLGRYGQAKVPLPGGCSIGKRGVDQHIKGLLALGATLDMEHGFVTATAIRLKGAKIVLDMPSVGATENILLAAVHAEGASIVSNVAQEPEIVDLVTCLNAMGADITGAGTGTLIINGVTPGQLHGITYEVMPDRIEAGTFIAAVAGAGGDVTLNKVRPDHLDAVLDKVQSMGVTLDLLSPTTLRVVRDAETTLKATSIHTTFYPGFPTDMQAPLMTLLTVAEGTSMVAETVYENRFRHVSELRRMGATIELKNDVAVVTGVLQLSGAQVKAHDLRAGAAMVVAGLMAEGETQLFNLSHLDRGYENLCQKLQALGAGIDRIPLAEDEESFQTVQV
jgi:UDP-N-acetylglucosamine 1-carboxyvinyltransferase